MAMHRNILLFKLVIVYEEKCLHGVRLERFLERSFRKILKII